MGIRGALGGREVITTVELLEAINADDELPFGAWREGKGLDARTLARLLKPYGVKPRVLRVGDETPRGYRRQELRDVFERYLPIHPPEAQQAKHTQHEERGPTGNPDENGSVADVAQVALPAGTANGGPPGDTDAELARVASKFLDGDEIDLTPPSQPNGASRCECNPPIADGDDCSKCGRAVA